MKNAFPRGILTHLEYPNHMCHLAKLFLNKFYMPNFIDFSTFSVSLGFTASKVDPSFFIYAYSLGCLFSLYVLIILLPLVIKPQLS